MSQGPSIALFGPTGFVGKELTPTFLEALDAKQISSLTLLTREPSSSKLDVYRKRSAKILEADLTDVAALAKSLKDVDIVVSALGTKSITKQNKQVLIEAGRYLLHLSYMPRSR